MTSQKSLTIIPRQGSLSKKQSTGQNKPCFHDATMNAELSTKLINMRLNGDLCDLTISAESSSFKTEAHRLVLALKSPFFKKHFAMDQDMKEFKFSKAFTSESIEGIIGYLYGKELEITEENVEFYLKISVLLEVSRIHVFVCFYCILSARYSMG